MELFFKVFQENNKEAEHPDQESGVNAFEK